MTSRKTNVPFRMLLAALCCLIVAACRGSTPSEKSGSIASSSEAGDTTSAMAPLEVPSASEAQQRDPPQAREMRDRLVRQIEAFDRPWGKERGWDPRVIEALKRVPRHLFMPGASIAAAYRDMPHPIGYGQTISQPTVVALMTQALRLSGSEKVLEIGTGSGYQAAVLSVLAREVYSIEIVEPLGNRAAQRLAELGYRNVQVRVGDGYKGWPEHAPFDRIILTAAPPQMPRALVEQLSQGGIIVAPVGEDDQTLVRWRKLGNELEKEELGSVRFVPMVPSEERQ